MLLLVLDKYLFTNWKMYIWCDCIMNRIGWSRIINVMIYPLNSNFKALNKLSRITYKLIGLFYQIQFTSFIHTLLIVFLLAESDIDWLKYYINKNTKAPEHSIWHTYYAAKGS